MSRRLVAIVGATASGKSAAALRLAQRLGGEIVNGDSRQIYRGMDIGTAKPMARERQMVRHHLYDVIEPTETYSLALYVKDARAALEEIWGRGSFAWLVGGTGQYVWALLEAWTVPEVPPDAARRAELARFAAERGREALHRRLRAVDATAAERIDPRNVRRVVRALEVFEATGVPISEWQSRGEPAFEWQAYGLDVRREALDARIDERVEEMFAAGIVAEVQALLAAGVPGDAPAMSSIGYREVARRLRGEITLDEAKALTKRATRRLVRRQAQWFRRDDPRIAWVPDADAIERSVGDFAVAAGRRAAESPERPDTVH